RPDLRAWATLCWPYGLFRPAVAGTGKIHRMGKCSKCDSEVPAGANFCPNCASPVAPLRTISGTDTIPPQSQGSGPRAVLEKEQEFHGRYVIERMLGAGAMGVVYQANDKVTGRMVALKLINPVLVDSESARKRFIREGLIAREIRHKNIVATY